MNKCINCAYFLNCENANEQLENFTGSYKCFNFVKGEKTNDDKR